MDKPLFNIGDKVIIDKDSEWYKSSPARKENGSEEDYIDLIGEIVLVGKDYKRISNDNVDPEKDHWGETINDFMILRVCYEICKDIKFYDDIVSLDGIEYKHSGYFYRVQWNVGKDVRRIGFIEELLVKV